MTRPKGHKRWVVLTIEDDPKSRELIKFLLGSEHYQIHEADNGWDGLRLTLELEPDLILLDISIPKLDGLTLAESLKSQKFLARTQIIAVTADTSSITRKRAAEVCVDYITKPIDPDTFETRIQKVLNTTTKEPK